MALHAFRVYNDYSQELYNSDENQVNVMFVDVWKWILSQPVLYGHLKLKPPNGGKGRGNLEEG